MTLHIVGEVTAEFYQFYKNDIENSENILYYGFLNKDTVEYKKICEQCGFCICPSCSEGQSTAVITTMFSGIVPVCTKETGIDVKKAGGILIESIELFDLETLISQLAKMTKEEFIRRSETVYDYVERNHTVENYRQKLGVILDEVLANGCYK